MRFDPTDTTAVAPAPRVEAPALAHAAAKPAFGFTLGGRTQTKATASSGKSYPVLPDPDQSLARLGRDIKLQTEQVEALAGALERNKKLLVEKARPLWFTLNAGKGTVESSVVVETPEGQVMVSFQERFGRPESPEKVADIIGPEALQAHFRPAFEFKVDCNALPEGPQTQELLNEVYQLFERRGVTAAIQFTSSVKPRKGFNTARHSLFTPDQNQALDRICPIIAAVKTKGRGEGK